MDYTEIIKQSKASIEKADLEELLPLLAEIKPKHILEIGTWKGYSAEVWIKAFKPSKFVTIEKDDKPSDAIEISHKNHKYFWGTNSHTNTILFNTEPYDFLFIDGDHSYEGVRRDFEMYASLVRKGGIVVFHDALYHADKTEEVDIYWNEIKHNYKHKEIKNSPNSTGIGVLFL